MILSIFIRMMFNFCCNGFETMTKSIVMAWSSHCSSLHQFSSPIIIMWCCFPRLESSESFFIFGHPTTKISFRRERERHSYTCSSDLVDVVILKFRVAQMVFFQLFFQLYQKFQNIKFHSLDSNMMFEDSWGLKQE